MISRERLYNANKKAKRRAKSIGWSDHWRLYRKVTTFCSNPYCCGNPRKGRGRNNDTLQERRANDIFKHDTLHLAE